MRIISKGIYSKFYDLANCLTHAEFIGLFHSKLDECDEVVRTFNPIFDKHKYDKKFIKVFADAVEFTRGRVQWWANSADGRRELELMSDYVDLAFSYMMTYVGDMYSSKANSPWSMAPEDPNERIIFSCDQIMLAIDEYIARGEKNNYDALITLRNEIDVAMGHFEKVLSEVKDAERVATARKDLEHLLTDISLDIIRLQEPTLLKAAKASTEGVAPFSEFPEWPDDTGPELLHPAKRSKKKDEFN